MKRPALAIVKYETFEARVDALEVDYGILLGTVRAMQREMDTMRRRIKDINYRETV